MWKERVYIPKNQRLQEDIIREHHDSIIAGHLGQYKTQELITCNYWRPYIQSDIHKYISRCETCQRTKAHQEKPHNPLHPNEIPKTPWEHISVDLISELMESSGFNAILVITNHLSKMIITVPTNMELTASETARIFRDHVWSIHRLPRKVISDRGPQFVVQFMRDLYKLNGTQGNLLTAYHPQTDGQTEYMNQEVEQYLHIFINHKQSDWSEWLSCASFSYNNKVHSATGNSPFYVIDGRHPNTGVMPRRTVKSFGATQFAERMKKVHEEAELALTNAQETMKRNYNQHKNFSREYKKGDKVWLEGTNITMNRPMKKLDDK